MDSFNTQILDIDIEDARAKKEIANMKMNSIMMLMREVELREKAAQKAKQEVDDCTLEIMTEIHELQLAQQRAKETNDKRAREVYTQKANLATEMDELLYRLSGVLIQGDGCIAAIDDMYISLEKRLTSAVKQREAAEEEKLQKEAALAYQRIQTEKLVEESKKLEQQAMENLKMQEFLKDRGQVVDMLQDDISCKCQYMNQLKCELEDYEDQSKISVTEDCMRPIIPGMLPRRNCEWFKIVKSPVNYPEFIIELAMDLFDEDNPANLKIEHPKSHMKKLVDESERTEQEAMDNPKLQEFLVDHGNVVNMSRDEIFFESQDVDLQKEELEDHEDENGMLANEDYSMPIPRQNYENDRWHGVLKGGIKKRVDDDCKEAMRRNKIVKPQMNSKMKEMKKWILGQITEDSNFA
ncbi:hypothetical protein R6Q57_028174 [Mikania cordata]